MIGEIEQAIIARLKAASDAGVLGYKFRAVESYPEDWDEYLKDVSVLPAPAAWVVFAGWRKLEGPVAAPTVEMTFGVVFMAENARNETATRHGGIGPAEPGSYQLAKDGANLLGGHDLGLAIGPLEPRSMRIVSRFPALKERRVSMVAVELATEVQLVFPDQAADDDADPFVTFHADWDIPRHGNVDGDPDQPGVQVPADATADATDQVQLEQN